MVDQPDIPSSPLASATAPWRACVLIPAYNAERTLGAVVDELRAAIPLCREPRTLLVVNDGSTDNTARVAKERHCEVISIEKNSGKGAALKAGFVHAQSLGFEVVLTVDADGQHPAESARTVLFASDNANALVLGVRDLARVGAPKKNRFSNGVSNTFLSWFTGTRLQDTQCGLRRYPLERTLALGGVSDGYAFEAEILMRALAAKVPVEEYVVDVRYPKDRTTHFDTVKDPIRMIVTVLRTLKDTRGKAG